MASLFSGLFAQQNFIPHGFCLAWEPGLLGLHVISDSIIAIAYYSIPFALLYFISRRRDLAFRGIFALSEMRRWLDHERCDPSGFTCVREGSGAVIIRVEFTKESEGLVDAFEQEFVAFSQTVSA